MQDKSIDWEWFGEAKPENEHEKGAWYTLFQHLLHFGKQDNPTLDWLLESEKILQELGPEKFRSLSSSFLTLFLEDMTWYKGLKSTMLKAFLWVMASADGIHNPPLIEAVIRKAGQKSPKQSRSARIARSGIQALLDLENPQAFLSLLNLSQENFAKTILRQIKEAIDQLRPQFWQEEEKLRDESQSDYGIQDKSLEINIEDYQAQIYIETYQKIRVEWLRPDGKIQKTEPARLKKEHSTELNRLRELKQSIKKSLQIERRHLEELWRKKRSWAFEDWEKYYKNHGLRTILLDGLIWTFQDDQQSQNLLYWQDRFWNAQAQEVHDIPQGRVLLWHPVLDSSKEVLAWRDFIFDKEIRQCFKQAFREIYVLTEAEKNTFDYSNRFSAHILNQSKLWALTRQRDWKFQGAYGISYEQAELELLHWNLKVGLDLVPVYGEYLSTQRLSFYDLASEEALEIEKIPPLIFSEVFRDIDLFIAVCSIGSDPNWDGRDDYKRYWQDYAFGEKSETVSAQTRKDLLRRIVPKLKIASQCRFEGNFLIVEGKVRSYKINLGSGNILMYPNDEYLCIIPDPSPKKKSSSIFLPFEGDSILSLILSKAFLLAEDDQIQDPVILDQIQ